MALNAVLMITTIKTITLTATQTARAPLLNIYTVIGESVYLCKQLFSLIATQGTGSHYTTNEQ